MVVLVVEDRHVHFQRKSAGGMRHERERIGLAAVQVPYEVIAVQVELCVFVRVMLRVRASYWLDCSVEAPWMVRSRISTSNVSSTGSPQLCKLRG